MQETTGINSSVQQITSEIELAMVLGALLFAIIAGFVVFFIISYKARQRQHKTEKQQLQLQFNSELSRAQLELSEQLMRNISQEIHDNIGQSLMLAKMHLDRSGEENSNLKSGRELVERSLVDLRNLSRSLNGSYILNLGFISAIEREAELIRKGGSIDCRIELLTENFNLGNQKEVILFRCVQELLSNAIRHSGCNTIDIIFDEDQNFRILSVCDNGKGIDLKSIKEGVGLSSLQQRVKILNGKIDFDHLPSGGTRAIITLPVE